MLQRRNNVFIVFAITRQTLLDDYILVILPNRKGALYVLDSQLNSVDIAMSGLRSSNPLLLGIGAADAADSGCGTQYDRGIPSTCWPMYARIRLVEMGAVW